MDAAVSKSSSADPYAFDPKIQDLRSSPVVNPTSRTYRKRGAEDLVLLQPVIKLPRVDELRVKDSESPDIAIKTPFGAEKGRNSPITPLPDAGPLAPMPVRSASQFSPHPLTITTAEDLMSFNPPLTFCQNGSHPMRVPGRLSALPHR